MRKYLTVFIVLLILAMTLTACSSGGSVITTTTATVPPATKTTTPPPTTTTVEPATSIAPTTTAAWDGPPVISDTNVDTISYTSAKFTGAIGKGAGIDQQGFEWGTSPGTYTSNYIAKGEFSAGTFTRLIEDLTEGTTYYYRCKAHNSKGWGTSEEKTFRTLGAPKITSVTAGSAFVGDTLTVIISGSYFTGATSLAMGDGVTVVSFSVDSDTKISADIRIASNAATGPRTVTVVTELGTGTLAAGFTVKENREVLHTVRWNDVKFNEVMHLITGNAYEYTIRSYENNQLAFTGASRLIFNVEVRDGKLCFTNVPSTIWHDCFEAGIRYLSYDSLTLVMTFNGMPDTVLQTYFDVPQTALPQINSATCAIELFIITYYQMEIIDK